MQLNDKSKGKKVVIADGGIKLYSNRIVYDIYNEKSEKGKPLFYEPDPNVLKLSSKLKEAVCIEQFCYELLKENVISLTDYVLEEDTQNWLSGVKSMRFFIPSELIVSSLKNKLRNGTDAFYDVIVRMFDDQKDDPDILIFDREGYTVIYANSISESNQGAISALIYSITDDQGETTVINPEGVIKVEHKIV